MKNTCLLILFLTIGLSINVNAETNKDKIIKILEVTETVKLADQVTSNLFSQLAPLFPEKAQPVLNGLTKAISFEENKELLDAFVNLYSKHYTNKELDAMLEFYSSEEGKSIIKKTPIVMQEAMTIGQIYGRMQAKKIIQQMKEKGFEPKPI